MKDLETASHGQILNLYDPEEIFDNQVLNLKGAARLLKYSTKTVAKLAQQGKIPCRKIGSEYRFLLSELLGVFKKEE